MGPHSQHREILGGSVEQLAVLWERTSTEYFIVPFAQKQGEWNNLCALRSAVPFRFT